MAGCVPVIACSGGAWWRVPSYWRHIDREVDFVVRAGRRLTAIEVKSGRVRDALPGMQAFRETFGSVRTLLVGGDGLPLGEFLLTPVERLLGR